MKKLMLGIAALSLIGMPAMAEIKVSNQLSVSGFVDMSAGYGDDSSGANSMGLSLDQAEIDFMFKFSDMLSAQVDLESSADIAGPVHVGFVEQGFITAVPTPGLSITAGRFLSSSGFETEEPTGLFQYSVSKNLGADKLYGHYQNGVGIKFAQPMFSIYGSAVTNVWTFNGADTDLEYPGFEVQLAVMPVEGLTAKAHYLVQTYNESVKGEPQSLVNAWLMYAAGMITVAGEFNYMIDWAMPNGSPDPLDNGMGWLGMVNLSFGKPAVTIRTSGVKWDGASDPDMEVTIAPSVAVTDNLGIIAEYKRNINAESNEAALEALLMF